MKRSCPPIVLQPDGWTAADTRLMSRTQIHPREEVEAGVRERRPFVCVCVCVCVCVWGGGSHAVCSVLSGSGQGGGGVKWSTLNTDGVFSLFITYTHSTSQLHIPHQEGAL